MRRVIVGCLITAAVLSAWSVAQAQESTPAPVSNTTSSETATGRVRAAVLGRKIDLALDHVTLKHALATVADAAHIRITYSPSLVPVDKVVSLAAHQSTLGDALTALLEDTGIDPFVSPSGWVTLERHGSDRALASTSTWQQQGSATISGLVTDSGTGAIITQAVVHVDGTQLTVRTNATGHYTVSGLAAGEYRITARHVGYLSKTHVVTLADGATKTADFELNEPATTLNEVVTTALGDQRRYQVGNVIATINVDSIAPDAPVTSVTDLITGRAPGVDVVESSGMVGSGEDIRIRGVSSLLLQGDPIIIVDGVREDNTAGGAVYYGFTNLGEPASGSEPAPYRLNDLDISQIATIDILKGPAATTEYGTDGANGVIIITTKRGISGHPQWTTTATQSASTVPLTYPPIVWNWGHSTTGTATLFTNANGTGTSCWVQLGIPVYVSNYYVVNNERSTLTGGECVVDSTTSFNPLDHAATTEYGTGPSSKYDVDVGGGSDVLRYYFAGSVSNQTGVFKVPDVFRPQALSLGFSNSLLQPNTQNQGELRANTTIKASSAVDVQVDVAYMSTYADYPEQSLNSYGSTAATDNLGTDFGYAPGQGYNPGGPLNSPLAYSLGYNYSQGIERWTGSTIVRWRPASWLLGNIAAGLDHAALNQVGLYAPQAGLLASDYTDTAGNGALSQQQGRNDLYNVSLQESATATLWHVVRLITAFGASYVDTRSSSIAASASGLSASSFTLDGAANVRVSTSAQAVKSGGMYVEENLAFGDWCYAPIGLRFDVASGYGGNVPSTTNPNYALTCTVLNGRTSLRLRGAYGVSDQQPPYGANFGLYYVTQYQTANQSSPSTVYQFNWPGNQNVKPERDQEVEGGFDLGFLNNRFQVGFTAYNKRAHDLLYAQGLGFDLQGLYYENVGNARNEGLEANMTAVVVQTRPLTLSVTVDGSVNHNKLLTLAPDLLTTSIGDQQYFARGYPLFGYWGDSMTYKDVNGDGILEQYDLSVGSTPVFAGSSAPVEMMSMAPSVGLWRNTLMINAMFEYEGDYKVYNASIDNTFRGPIAGLDPGVDVLNAPLWEQAMGVVSMAGGCCGAYSDQFLDGTYAALNELSVAISLPRQWVRAVRLRGLSVVGAVRNLALWTSYPFGDPRVGVSAAQVTNNASNTSSPNNDIRSTQLGVVPLTRQWTLRLNAGL